MSDLNLCSFVIISGFLLYLQIYIRGINLEYEM